MPQIGTAKTTQGRSHENRLDFIGHNVDARGFDGLIVVFDAAQDQSEIFAHQPAQGKQCNNDGDNNRILLDAHAREGVQGADPLGAAQNAGGNDDVDGKQRKHEADDREIDVPEAQAGGEHQRADDRPAKGGNGDRGPWLQVKVGVQAS